MPRIVAGIAVVFACVLGASSIGCGEAAVGDAVSGTVTFNGAPLPAGMIYFDPDSSAGGQGAQGAAKIVDGAFDTTRSGQGAPSGAVIVRIEGYEKHPTDAESFGPIICRWETKDSFSGSGTKTYEVPESAAVTEKPSPEA